MRTLLMYDDILILKMDLRLTKTLAIWFGRLVVLSFFYLSKLVEFD
uniref:Uncharacterized protein n=1 Tax=Siphoviridae sp. ctHl62 TaxID=2826235 RepID=A0A8S5MGZ2_9CAUD|nr:MAG TPA: hypothetical protein [Siphoviridae sp. ctHl62]